MCVSNGLLNNLVPSVSKSDKNLTIEQILKNNENNVKGRKKYHEKKSKKIMIPLIFHFFDPKLDFS